ncbi:unnamed protein product [Schistosoma mattheei]|uniref:Uncharacterized protein n=1 Tax=Schistosoma mattheei TaxID=31246 RepID=A0A183PH30_9TREM|nr:unnamed protein product [Schistosoma mattheei]
MLVKPGLSELRMLDDSLCSIIVVSEGLLTHWQHHVSNAEVRHRVFGHRDDNPLDVTILKYRLRWLGHVLRMLSQGIPRRALFADSGTG